MLRLLPLAAAFAFLSSAAAGPLPACSPLPVPPHSLPCPPFRSPPAAFPFSASPGCGHPSFQIRCASPHSLLSLNSSLFLLLSRGPASLLLSPSPRPPPHAPRCVPLPARPIDFASSPFRPASTACQRLSALRSCLPPPRNFSSSCRLTSWQRRLLERPRLLLSGCAATSGAAVGLSHRRLCDGDVAASIASFLRAGIRVEWDPATDPYYGNCSSCKAAGGFCGFNDSAVGKPFLCFHSVEHLRGKDGAAAASTGSRRLLLTAACFAAACLLTVLVLSICAVAAFRRRRSGGLGCAAERMSAFLRRHQLLPPVFTYEELRAATGCFDPFRKIGDGGFGSVYLADFGGGRSAAVKRLHRHHPEAASAATTTKSFCNEILILSSLRHPNLVRLHGYCADPRGLLLVYDYVPNGTLADHLHGARSRAGGARGLAWAVRVDVALQTAAALEYLHSVVKPPVVHRDVTSSNIFIEADMRVRLGDFGLSRLLALPDACSTSGSRELICCTGPQGTPGYLDPEYHRSFRLTEKSDIYSFGVVLLELVTGMKAVDSRRERREVALADLAVGKIQVGELRQVLDPLLVTEKAEAAMMASIEAVAELAFRCVAGDKDDRPEARELVTELSRIREKLHEASGNGSSL